MLGRRTHTLALLSSLLIGGKPRAHFQLVKEYALSGRPPMMTHIWEKGGKRRIIACKGAVERVLEVASAHAQLREEVLLHMESMASKGFRVLGVASALFDGEKFPADQALFQ